MYCSVQGFVYAGPFENEVGGKKVRKYMVSAPTIPGQEDMKVAVTVWPTHDATEVKVGDWIVANGKFEGYPGQDKDGAAETKWSLSANKLAVHTSDESDGTKRSVAQVKDTTVKKDRNTDFSIPGLE